MRGSNASPYKTVYWDLKNSNMNRDVQEECANGLYRVYTCSSNTDDENNECFAVYLQLCIIYSFIQAIMHTDVFFHKASLVIGRGHIFV